MEYTIENLDELYSARETAALRLGVMKSQYAKAIEKLQVEKSEKIKDFEKDINSIDTLIEMIVGDQETIVTPAGTFKRKTYNPKKASSYDVQVKTNQDTIALLEKNSLLASAVKVETKETKTVNKTPIKELLASGAMTVSNDGHLVDENGEILAIAASLKHDEIKFKANK